MLTASCGGGGDGRFDVLLVGSEEAALSEEPPYGEAAKLVREATGSGLVALDAEGRIRPDLAARWIVTDDGLSYIFRIERQPDAIDTNAAPPTAPEVRKALLAAIRDMKGTGLARDLDVIDGIYARTSQVIEIRLRTAMPEFLQLMAVPELSLKLPEGETDALDLTADGPLLTLSEPVFEDRTAGTLDIRVAKAKDAVERFQRGEAELMLGGGIDALPHVEFGLLRGTIRLDPVAGLFGLAVADSEGFLAEASNREALAMAIDRDALIAPFKIGGWTPRTRLVPVGLPGTQQPPGRWDDLSIEQRQGFAAQRVAGWVASNGAVAPLTIALPTGTGGNILFRRLSADLGRIGLAAKRVGPDENADLRLVDEVAYLDRPEWYLHRLDCTVIRAVCSADADALVYEALGETAAPRRDALLAEAEAMLTAQNGFISFGPPIRFSLVRGGVAGFAINRWGFHPLSQLFVDTN
ncbi:ABC transporter substrate-binding protein [Croceicoccus naphthovorans]|uniref:ABC transporter substrate-binding protein n=1 Tax=Croceicoccus naphthovorans TaxID=1348774 RepID=UPI0012E07012|nr:peptide ABC transporter substrate-binding protein [Croceicoccus naphthovorans]